MKKLLQIASMAVAMAVSCSVSAQEGFRTLDKIATDANSVSMTVSGETKYHAFKITNPPRIVVEFTNTEFDAKERELTGTGELIKRIRGGQFQNEPVKIARIVVDLVKMVEYELKGEGNLVKLMLSGPQTAKETAETQEAVSEDKDDTPVVIAEPVTEKDTEKIDIKSPKASKAIPSMDSTEPLIDVKAEMGASKTAAPAAVKPALKQKKAAAQQAQTSKSVVMPKKPITIDFEEADIKDVFRMLSMKSGINIIYGPDVSGTITLRLENVPFDKAFETILALKNLVSQEQGPNIIRVATPAQITEERAQAVTFTKVFPLNYANAEDVKGNLDSIRMAEGRRGSISVDLRTNSLIITDTPEGLVSLEKIIRELDCRPAQVIIEARIVEVQLTNDMDLGIQWQYAKTLVNEPNNRVTIGMTEAAVGNRALGADATVGDVLTSPVNTVSGGTGVSLPASAVSGQLSSIAFGIVSNDTYLTGVLSALAQKGLSKLLSNPKVTTVNNKEAKILVGQRIPYTTTTVTNTGSTQMTQFLDVGVKLTVTPTINADRKITLVVHPEVSLFVRADAAGPVVGTREANTTVIVNDAETVVIGGLITEQDIKQGTQVPLLGDIPIIGHLFKRQYDTKSRTELLVFLTPQIVEN